MLRFEIAWPDSNGRHLHSEGVFCAHNGDRPKRPRFYCEHTTWEHLRNYRVVYP